MDSGKCEHVKFAWAIPEVIKVLMKKGFKEPEF